MIRPETDAAEPQLVTVCAWCGSARPVAGADTVLLEGMVERATREGRVSHGMCADCSAEMGGMPVEDLRQLDDQAIDALPFGLIQIDSDGKILCYNQWEEKLARRTRSEVVGQNFFRDVAPCTGVREFEGRYRELVDAGRPDRDELDFIFKFAHGETRVRISLSYLPEWDRGFILVQTVE